MTENKAPYQRGTHLHEQGHLEIGLTNASLLWLILCTSVMEKDSELQATVVVVSQLPNLI